MPAKTETDRPVFPSDAEFADAAGAFRAPIQEIANLRWHIDGVGDFKSERTPTFEDIGKVVAFLIEADARMAELHSYLGDIRANVKELDYVRELENRSDDRRAEEASDDA